MDSPANTEIYGPKDKRHVLVVSSKDETPLYPVIINVVDTKGKCITQQYMARRTNEGKLVLHELSGMQRVFCKADVFQHKDNVRKVIFVFTPVDNSTNLEEHYFIRIMSGGSCVDSKLSPAQTFPGLG